MNEHSSGTRAEVPPSATDSGTPEPFTTKELAQEMLIWFERDVPETVVRSLRIVLNRYVDTGVYDDGMTEILGYTPDHLLTTQRFATELQQAHAKYDVAVGVLNQISDMPRKTRERNMANACVHFLQTLADKPTVIWTEKDIARLDAALAKCFPPDSPLGTDSAPSAKEINPVVAAPDQGSVRTEGAKSDE